MKSRNVHDASLSKLEGEQTRLARKDHLSHDDRGLLRAVRREIKHRRKLASRQPVLAAAQ